MLVPSDADNVYDEMGLVPHDLRPALNKAKVRVVNYQAFTQKDLIGDPAARKLLGESERRRQRIQGRGCASSVGGHS